MFALNPPPEKLCEKILGSFLVRIQADLAKDLNFLKPIWENVRIKDGIISIQTDNLKEVIYPSNLTQKFLGPDSGSVDQLSDSRLKFKITLFYILLLYAELGENGKLKRKIHLMLDPYLSMIRHLNEMEAEEKQPFEGMSRVHPDIWDYLEKQEQIENKYDLLRIVAKYNTMNVQMGAFQILNDNFLYSNDSRREMLTEGSIMWFAKNEKDEKILRTFGISNLIPSRLKILKQDNALFNIKAIQYEIVGFLNQLTKVLNGGLTKLTSDFDPKLTIVPNSLHVWGGVGMIIPPQVQVVISFSQIYPTLFIRKKEGENEVFVEESPWNINWGN